MSDEHVEVVYNYGDRQLHTIVNSRTSGEVMKWWTKCKEEKENEE